VGSTGDDVEAGDDAADLDAIDVECARLVRDALAGSGVARGRLIETAVIARAKRSAALDEILDDLARRAAAGDEAAIELLLELVHRLGLARGAITSIIFDTALVDDVAQMALIAVEQRIGSYEGRAKFRTWLHTVARNEALMMLRRRQAEPVEHLPESSARFSSVVVGRLAIEDVVNGLPEPYRETLRLQVFANLDYDAIAQRLDVPVGTVRSRLAKARELLRNALTSRDT
jgi:RNA polymerase sigma-70 factor (ECF subfamily)